MVSASGMDLTTNLPWTMEMSTTVHAGMIMTSMETSRKLLPQAQQVEARMEAEHASRALALMALLRGCTVCPTRG